MKHFLYLLLIIVAFSCKHQEVEYKLSISEVACNNHSSPKGIIENPMFSWKINSTEKDVRQEYYRLLVADDESLLDQNEGNVWDSEKMNSSQSINQPYLGKGLVSAKKYFWKVKVWDYLGNETPWSKTNSFFTGFLADEEWHGAHWIGAEVFDTSKRLVPGVSPWGKKVDHLNNQKPKIPYFRKAFSLKRKVKSAYLFISGIGQYEANINGEKVSEGFLNPAWSDFDKTVYYNAYDVTEFVKKGKNALGVLVGHGFNYINNVKYRKLLIAYGFPKLKCVLKVTYKDGSMETILSDEAWKTNPSPITFTSLYRGEDYDATKEIEGWDMPGLDESNWDRVVLANPPKGNLMPQIGYPIKVMETFNTEEINKLAKDTFVYDFGQNTSGILEIKVKGNKGDTVRLFPAELLTKTGRVFQKFTGSPYYYQYILKGKSVETWRPRFSYYGFRYVQLEGGSPSGQNNDSDIPEVLSVAKLFTRNSAPNVGSFSCSNELFNQTYKIIDYAIKSNMMSVLTDCPHREKLGWIEQTYLMGSSVNYNYNVYQMYRRLVYNMIDAQEENGMVPTMAPEYVYFGYGFNDTPEWGIASIMVPWFIYKWYDDVRILKEAWPMMMRYVYYLEQRADNYILDHGLGDWYDIGPELPGYAQLTPRSLSATASYYQAVKTLTEIAAILGYGFDMEVYAEKAEAIKQAFNNQFFDTENAVYATGSQTAMAMPLSLGMVDEAYKERVLQNLIDSIHANNNQLTSGDIGFHYLVQVLTDEGQSELLYEMNNRNDVPGYGYQLKKGGTALAESWQALETKSNNHLMLGHLMQWFFEGIGGINQDENSFGFRKVTIKPVFVGDLTWAKASYNSIYGNISSQWKREGQWVQLTVEIPVNTGADVLIPAKASSINIDGVAIADNLYTTWYTSSEGLEHFSLPSGNYFITFELNP